MRADSGSLLASLKRGRHFFRMESAGGIVLMIVTVLTLLIANSPLVNLHQAFLDIPIVFKVGPLEIDKPMLLWINDGLMAVFFFLVGLELKRELINGELSDRSRIILPGVGAVGGMLFPALIYVAFNWGDELAIRGWAIPAATDIAFALGILMLLGSRVPTSMKVFLTSLAIFDDVGAILIIAFFYTDELSVTALLVAAACLPILYVLNRMRLETRVLFFGVGIILWIAILKSGIHATLAGVLVAIFIPMEGKDGGSPLKEMEHDLHGVVVFCILPIFAFANAGLNLSGVGAEQLFHPVSLGVALGLLVGKAVGVFLCCALAIRLRLTTLPDGFNWVSLFGVSALCGIGFTMSLFIGSLAFGGSSASLLFDERIGILLGSLLSGCLGYAILSRSLPATATAK